MRCLGVDPSSAGTGVSSHAENASGCRVKKKASITCATSSAVDLPLVSWKIDSLERPARLALSASRTLWSSGGIPVSVLETKRNLPRCLEARTHIDPRSSEIRLIALGAVSGRRFFTDSGSIAKVLSVRCGGESRDLAKPALTCLSLNSRVHMGLAFTR